MASPPRNSSTEELFFSHRDLRKSFKSRNNRICDGNTIGVPFIKESQSLVNHLTTDLKNVKGTTQIDTAINKMLISANFITKVPATEEIKEILNLIKNNYDSCAQTLLEEYINFPSCAPNAGSSYDFTQKREENSEILTEILQLEQSNKDLTKSFHRKSEELEYLKNYEKRLQLMPVDVKPRGIVENIESKRKELKDKVDILSEMRTDLISNCHSKDLVNQIRLSRIDALTEINDLENQNVSIASKIKQLEDKANELLDLIGVEDDKKSALIRGTRALQSQEKKALLVKYPFLSKLKCVMEVNSSDDDVLISKLPEWNFYIS